MHYIAKMRLYIYTHTCACAHKHTHQVSLCAFYFSTSTSCHLALRRIVPSCVLRRVRITTSSEVRKVLCFASSATVNPIVTRSFILRRRLLSRQRRIFHEMPTVATVLFYGDTFRSLRLFFFYTRSVSWPCELREKINNVALIFSYSFFFFVKPSVFIKEQFLSCIFFEEQKETHQRLFAS